MRQREGYRIGRIRMDIHICCARSLHLRFDRRYGTRIGKPGDVQSHRNIISNIRRFRRSDSSRIGNRFGW
jgi:hypothetical protein